MTRQQASAADAGAAHPHMATGVGSNGSASKYRRLAEKCCLDGVNDVGTD